MPEEVLDAVKGPLASASMRVVLAKVKLLQPLPPDYSFVADIVGNTICADLLDYLARDHLYTGLPAKLGHRFLDGFYVTPSDDAYYPRRMAIRIARGGRLRADVISELFKFLRYRYELSERVLVHHAKLAADAMIGKALESGTTPFGHNSPWVQVAGALTATLTSFSLERTSKRSTVALGICLNGPCSRTAMTGYWSTSFRDQPSSAPTDRRVAVVAHLASSVLNRDLYKPIGSTAAETRAMADHIHKKHGSFNARRRLEQRCARYAGLEHRWHILLWIPAAKMRMKAAAVLVDDGRRVQPLEDFDRAAGRKEDQKSTRATRRYGHCPFMFTSR